MTEHDKMREKVARAMPSYGTVDWALLIAAISEAQGSDWRRDPNPDHYIGHQIVTMNMNSLNRICSALAAMGITDETVVVPREPTEAMVIAGCRHENMGDMAGRYKAMIAAAPPAAAQEGE